MSSQAPATDTFGVFGTTAVLLVTDPAVLSRARVLADAELAAVDLACSRFRPDSELSILNGSNGRLTEVSELFAALIATALRAAELTDGDVDPTCGRALAAAGYDRDFSELQQELGRSRAQRSLAELAGDQPASGEPRQEHNDAIESAGERAADAHPATRNTPATTTPATTTP
ncbi:MAG TPA: FAD:protein FMN transferase, partial [Streptosporangiaceae bacterium]|nr:FAD:protein FMN transferase [Streptosporangiaceae bacterium]